MVREKTVKHKTQKPMQEVLKPSRNEAVLPFILTPKSRPKGTTEKFYKFTLTMENLPTYIRFLGSEQFLAWSQAKINAYSMVAQDNATNEETGEFSDEKFIDQLSKLRAATETIDELDRLLESVSDEQRELSDKVIIAYSNGDTATTSNLMPQIKALLEQINDLKQKIEDKKRPRKPKTEGAVVAA